MAGPIVLDPDFQEFIDCCIANEVRFLIVGGWAMAAHGHARATKDLDIWMWLDPGNAERMVRAIEQFGFGTTGLTSADLLDPAAMFVMGREPKRIDVLTTIDGVEFEGCWSRRVEVGVLRLGRSLHRARRFPGQQAGLGAGCKTWPSVDGLAGGQPA